MFKITKRKFLLLAMIVIIAGVIYEGNSYFRAGKRVSLNSLVIEQDLPSLTKNSTVIVVGTIEEILPSQISIDKNTGDKIVITDYVLSPEKVIKGSVGKDIIIRTIGGTVGEEKNKLTVIAEDSPDFKIGEKVLVFLSKGTDEFFDLSEGQYTVEGWFQGKYEIVDKNAKNVKKIIPLDQLENEISLVLQTK